MSFKCILLLVLTSLIAQGQEGDAALFKSLEEASRKWTKVESTYQQQFVELGIKVTLNKSAIEKLSWKDDYLQIDLLSGRKLKVYSTDSTLPISMIHSILSEVLTEGKREIIGGDEARELELFNLIERLSEAENTKENKMLLFKATKLYSKTMDWSSVSLFLEVEED